MKGMGWVFGLMLLSLLVASLWNSAIFGSPPVIKTFIHTILDPTVGVLMAWNVTIGMILVTLVLNLITTLLQKYFTDQETLKQIKEEQKLIQQEMKLAKEHPEKSLELSKKSMELTMKAMPITMRPFVFTVIPFVLLIQWFYDFVKVQAAAGHPVLIFGFLSGIWAYIVLSIIWSLVLKKVFKVH